MAGAARRADLADDGEDDVLGGHARRQRAVDLDPHVLGLGLDQRLGREHMLDLGGADAMRERAEGAVGRGVAVAADDRRARQGEALLRPDDVDDALARGRTRRNIRCRTRARSWPAPRPAARLSGSSMPPLRSVVWMLWSTTASVFSGARTLRPDMPQALEGLRARHLVDEVAVDIDEAEPARASRRHGRPRSCRITYAAWALTVSGADRREWTGIARYLCRMGRRWKGNRAAFALRALPGAPAAPGSDRRPCLPRPFGVFAAAPKLIGSRGTTGLDRARA